MDGDMVIRVRPRQADSRRSPRTTRIVDSIAAVAQFASVTVPSASAWFERGAPRTADGRYDLWEIARWHAENCARRPGAGPGAGPSAQAAADADPRMLDAAEADDAAGAIGPDETRSEWELRRVRAAALTAELRLQEARGEVVSRAQYDDAMFVVIDSFVSALENMPGRVTPLLVAARGYQEIDTILRDHIRTMRVQLAAMHSPKEEDGEPSGPG